MKYNIEDKVKVINKDSDAYGKVGVIKSIHDHMYPYAIIFNDENVMDQLFNDADLIPAVKDEIENKTDEDSKNKEPKDFINITFQNGTVRNNGVNGAQMEDVIDLLINRLLGFQRGPLSCRENALAITKLEEARMWLNERTRKRSEQGVKGKMKKHE